MIDVEKYYKNSSAKELVHIIEQKNKYKNEVIQYCKKRLSEKNISIEILKKYSIKFFQQKFYNYFVEGKHWSGEPIDLTSYFLDQREVKNCFKESKSEYITNRKNATTDLPNG